MKYSVIGLVVLGLIAAFSAAFLVAALGGPRSLGSEDEARQVTVLVAKADMPSITVIKAEAFEEQLIDAKQAPTGYLSQPVQAVGRALARPVVAGQALTEDCFAGNRRGIDLVAALAEGKRAVTVELTHAAGLEGLLYPGSVVDVIATFDVRQRGRGGEDMAVSTTLLHGVEVLAIDTETVSAEETVEGKAAEVQAGRLRKTRRVTLLVDTDQAKALQLAAEHGTVSLAMRNPLDKSASTEDPTLLSGGRLANLAEYLDGSVPRTGTRTDDAADPPSEAADAAPDTTSAKRDEKGPQRWDVTILRGSDVEVREMTAERGSTITIAADQR